MKEFPNGFESYLETHYEVVSYLSMCLNNTPEGKVAKHYNQHGTGGMYDLAKELTDKFETKFKDVVWGEEFDYMDTIDEFLEKELG